MTASTHSFPDSYRVFFWVQNLFMLPSSVTKAVTEGSKDNCGEVIIFHIHHKYDVTFVVPYIKNKFLIRCLLTTWFALAKI